MIETLSPVGPLVVFMVAGSRWAVPVQAVERVIHAVEITPRPSAPPVSLGTINVGGTMVPVYDLSRQGMQEIALEDMIVLVRTRRGLAGLWSNDVLGVVHPGPADLVPETLAAPGPGAATAGDRKGKAKPRPGSKIKLGEGVAHLQAPDEILSAAEAKQLAALP